MLRQVLPVLGLAAATFVGCSERPAAPGAQTASISIGELNTKAGEADWQNMKLALSKGEADKVSKDYPRSAFKESKLKDVTIKVEYGTYRFLLEFFDKGQTLVYESCPAEKTKDHVIQTSSYEAKIKVCKAKTSTPVGEVDLKPSADVSISPFFRGEQSGGNDDSGSTASGECKLNGQTVAGADEVYGSCVSQKDSWYVANGEIYRRGSPFALKGVNWFGLDGSDTKLHGLWSGRSIASFLSDLKSKGFNSLRIPLSPEVLTAPQGNYEGYATPLAMLKDLLKEAEQLQIATLLDIHTCSKDKGHASGSPLECPSYGQEAWLKDLRSLAELSKSYSYVVGIDLYNEPYKLTWDAWRAMADEGAKAVLSVNPKILVFVEGVGGSSAFGKEAPFWGENLFEADSKKLSVPKNRLVFSPHAYGPSVHEPHTYFQTANFPANMPAIWDEHFGYLKGKGYAIAIGEFGGKYSSWEKEAGSEANPNKDMKWQQAFVKYLKSKGIKNYFYWSLNPNSGDTKGLLKDDWKTWDEDKLKLLAPIL